MDAEPYRSIPKTNRPADIPPGYQLGPYYPIRGYEFYDGPNELRNLRCYAYHADPLRDAACISMLRDDQFSISPFNRASQILSPDDSTIISFPDLTHVPSLPFRPLTSARTHGC